MRNSNTLSQNLYPGHEIQSTIFTASILCPSKIAASSLARIHRGIIEKQKEEFATLGTVPSQDVQSSK